MAVEEEVDIKWGKYTKRDKVALDTKGDKVVLDNKEDKMVEDLVKKGSY